MIKHEQHSDITEDRYITMRQKQTHYNKATGVHIDIANYSVFAQICTKQNTIQLL